MIVDPRAGHGPGIGGFKRDPRSGWPCTKPSVYFVVFFPEPVSGQRLDDVLAALRHFVEEVASRHGGRAPVLYGNCQAGWAMVILAAACEGLAGPVVLNGSPLSYWAGESGVNPMRVAGGLLCGRLADQPRGRSGGRSVRRRLARPEFREPEAGRRLGQVRQPVRGRRRRAGPLPGVRAVVERVLFPQP